MTRPIRDLAQSVRQRLTNLAKARNRPFAELLQYFAIERFLWRLANSPWCDRFVLKGAIMLTAWRMPMSRPTMDIDLLGRGDNRATELARIVRELCSSPTTPADGMVYAADTVEAEQITVDAEYVGVRIRFRASLGTARVPMQIDVGFGDATVGGDRAELPPLLDFPGPVLRGYSRESTIAEKCNAMVQHGRLNSRMKDYFDICMLARHFEYDGSKLGAAVRATFAARSTAVPATPIGLEDEFAEQPGKRAQWAAFLRKIRVDDAPMDLATAVAAVRRFLGPVLAALASEGPFPGHWLAGGPWRDDTEAGN